MLIYSDLPYYSIIFSPLIAAIFNSHFHSVLYDLNKFTINKYELTFFRKQDYCLDVVPVPQNLETM